jgi:CheY-like chemotaxis protein
VEPLKILLVDDSKSARYALRLQLQRHGAQVETAESAEAALERVRETPPDAILMDHTMPGMNGFEALEILKSSLDTARIPVVMCTSHDDQAFSAQAVRRGALGVLTKAVAAERLPQVLDQIRATLAQVTLPEEEAGILERVVELAPPLPIGPSREEIETLVEERLAAVLPNRLTELVEPLVARINTQLQQVAAEEAAPPSPIGPSREEVESLVEERLAAVLPNRLTELVEPLVARINTQLRQVIVEQVEMAIDALPPPAPIPVPIPAPPVPPPPPPPAAAPPALAAADLDRLRDEIIPGVVRQHLETELDRVLALMQQCVQEGRSAAGDPEAMQQVLRSVEATVTAQAAQIAREEVAGAVAASQNQGQADALAAMQRGLRLSYALGAVALLLALGAAALVLIPI